MGKLRVGISALWYEVAMARFFWDALDRRDDVETFAVGPFFGDYIPWGGGMRLPQKYVKVPHVCLPLASAQYHTPYAMVAGSMPDDLDLFLTIDAGWHFSTKPTAKVNVLVKTDPHCVSGDTLVATRDGIQYVTELSSGKLRVATKNGMSESSGVVYKGLRTTRKFILDGGYELTCTDDHLIETPSGYVSASELKVRDRVLLVRGTYDPKPGTPLDYSIGFIVGAFQGDGSFGSSDIIKFTIGKERKVEFGEMIKFHLMRGFGIGVVTEGKHYTNENTKILQVRRWGLHRFLTSIHVKSGGVPAFIRMGSRELFAGYVAGLFAADGCSNNGLIHFATYNDALAKELQIMLLYYGILTRRIGRVSGPGSYKPGTKYWSLNINAGESTDTLASLVGYIPGRFIKPNSKPIKEVVGSHQWVEIVDIRGVIKNYPHLRCPEPVYDLMDCGPTTSFLAGGISVHNCISKQHYSVPKGYSDITFNMQTPYLEPGDLYLAYAFDPTIHYPMPEVRKNFDACLIGLQYEHRVKLIDALRKANISVKSGIGIVYDDYRLAYNQSRIALSWSSLLDTPTRVYEAMAMGIPLVSNRTPDLCSQFVEGRHFLGFDNVNEAVHQVKHILGSEDRGQMLAQAAYDEVQKYHSWDHRITQILETAGLI
jgi:glycosyltransferase involved in cell wall biosynthesis